jgi:hypothetical protein
MGERYTLIHISAENQNSYKQKPLKFYVLQQMEGETETNLSFRFLYSSWWNIWIQCMQNTERKKINSPPPSQKKSPGVISRAFDKFVFA